MPLQITTPARLHFGLLGWGPDAPRQFGGVGLMVEQPGFLIRSEPSEAWSASGPLSARALEVARQVADRLAPQNEGPVPLHLEIVRAIPEHVGLGAGTQLSLAVARLVAAHAGRADIPIEELAEATGRGLRSGVGLHGFARGGLIVDGGRRSERGMPPLLVRQEFPHDWHVLIVRPALHGGLHGPDEARAFESLPPMPDPVADRLCRLVLMGLLPAVVERDLDAFGAALTAIQHHVGHAFAPAQGGSYVRPELEPLVAALRRYGLAGVGQSSWGPTLYGFTARDHAWRAGVRDLLIEAYALDEASVLWTTAAHEGARLQEVDAET